METVSRCLLKPSIPMVKSDASLPRTSGSQRLKTLHHSREIGLAKRLERQSLSPSTVKRCYLSSDRRRVCPCSRSIRTILQCKDTLSGSHEIRMERSMACMSEHHECATCRSYA